MSPPDVELDALQRRRQELSHIVWSNHIHTCADSRQTSSRGIGVEFADAKAYDSAESPEP
jgi:hypothetical protein